MKISLAAVVLVLGAVLPVQADEYERALQEAIKQYPPGDYASPRAPAEVIRSAGPKTERELLLENLRGTTIPKLEFDRTTGARAFEMLQDAYSRQYSQGLPLKFEENTRTSGLLNRKISFSLSEITAEDALKSILKELDLRYEIRGKDILIKEKAPTGQVPSK